MRNKYQQRIQHYNGKAMYGYFLTAALHYRHSNNGYNYTLQTKMANVDKPMPPIENTPKHLFLETKIWQT